tara:strand:+ start:21564 stop:22403 length:840 start_codon:yes stop_codon:yes gene_type:complete
VVITTEDILLSYDLRGISKTRHLLNRHYCSDAASFVLSNSNRIIITTGFYITKGTAAETDGPPGAIALGLLLDSLGWDVTLLIDEYLLPCLESSLAPELNTLSFPKASRELSIAYSQQLLDDLQPTLLLSIERCGVNATGRYTNMRGIDISPFTPCIDTLFEFGFPSVGIGDGGNEIGMGKIREEALSEGIVLPWTTVPTDHLIISSVSNWGAYGLIAEICKLTQTNFEKIVTSQEEILSSMVASGAVDGVTGYQVPTVDSMPYSVHERILRTLVRFAA